MGCHALLQGIFPTQGSNLGLLHCRQILYHLSHKRSPYMLARVQNLSFPGGSSGKELASQCRRQEAQVGFLGREDPLEKSKQPTPYSFLEHPMDREAWQDTVHRVAKSGMQLKWLSMHTQKALQSLELFFLGTFLFSLVLFSGNFSSWSSQIMIFFISEYLVPQLPTH